MQALQLVAARRQRIKKARLLEEMGGVDVALVFGDGREIG